MSKGRDETKLAGGCGSASAAMKSKQPPQQTHQARRRSTRRQNRHQAAAAVEDNQQQQQQQQLAVLDAVADLRFADDFAEYVARAEGGGSTYGLLRRHAFPQSSLRIRRQPTHDDSLSSNSDRPLRQCEDPATAHPRRRRRGGAPSPATIAQSGAAATPQRRADWFADDHRRRFVTEPQDPTAGTVRPDPAAAATTTGHSSATHWYSAGKRFHTSARCAYLSTSDTEEGWTQGRRSWGLGLESA